MQLFAAEAPPNARQFVRKGTQDGGIEAYWELANGDLHALQAKFFRQIPQTSEWRQIQKSFEDAVTKHPKITKYTICLPVDRADPKTPGRSSFMDKWEHHVSRWKAWAKSVFCKPEIDYWGQSEILNRLSREQHRGRRYFWFAQEYFNRDWFLNKIEAAVANLGTRYMPSVHVDVPAAKSFDGLGRTPTFFAEFSQLRAAVSRNLRQVRLDASDEPLLVPVREATQKCVNLIMSLDPSGTDQLPFGDVSRLADAAAHASESLASELLDRDRKEREQKRAAQEHISYGYQSYRLRQLAIALTELKDWIDGTAALLANTPALLLSGKAGVGKSHLLCDIALRRAAEDRPTVLLPGEQFSDANPRSQMLEALGLSCSFDEFLGALNAAGQARRCRSLILIDALNEGEGVRLWKKHLAGFSE